MSGYDDELPWPPANAGDSKLQRWIDLISALLLRRHAVTFEELVASVPAYDWPAVTGASLSPAEKAANAKRRDSTKRTFERDKDELRAFGFPIETEADESGNKEGAYLLRRRDVYLPFLALVAPGKGGAPLTRLPADSAAQHSKTVAGSNYASLAMIAVEPDELQVMIDAATCACELGDPTLALEATRALRKLAFDLPVSSADGSSGSALATPTRHADAAQHDARVFQQLAAAVQRRKRVTMRYHAMERDEERERVIDPWGLFFISGHWYCAARDHDADAVRNFRLNRIRQLTVNGAKAQTPDFTVPATFQLRAHAASRHAWELGDDAPREVIVRKTAAGGTVDERYPSVRRVEPFIRWLLSFAGGAVPLAPASVVSSMRSALDKLAESLDRAEARAESMGAALDAVPVPTPKPAPRAARLADTAVAQLRRLLEMLPHLAGGDDVPIDELLQRTGIPFDTLRDDVYALICRYDAPAGFIERVQLYLTSEYLSATTDVFQRPLRLLPTEVCALSLGLSVLTQLRPPDERDVIARARQRVRSVMATMGDDPLLEGMVATLHEGGSLHTLYAVRTALESREVLRMTYRHPNADDVGEGDAREIEPYALVASGARLYVVAHCRRARALRLFRIDRMLSAERTGETFALPPNFSLDQVLAHGKAFMRGAHDLLVVRYTPTIARWIAEREGVLCDADGSLTLSHPLADEGWAIRHVMQYAGDVELLAPAALREQIRERLARLREALPVDPS
jgi:predicted DNA-binding transcriptional regulator YafY